jgi:hypothetical protein
MHRGHTGENKELLDEFGDSELTMGRDRDHHAQPADEMPDISKLSVVGEIVTRVSVHPPPSQIAPGRHSWVRLSREKEAVDVRNRCGESEPSLRVWRAGAVAVCAHGVPERIVGRAGALREIGLARPLCGGAEKGRVWFKSRWKERGREHQTITAGALLDTVPCSLEPDAQFLLQPSSLHTSEVLEPPLDLFPPRSEAQAREHSPFPRGPICPQGSIKSPCAGP